MNWMQHYRSTDNKLNTYFAESLPPVKQRNLAEKDYVSSFYTEHLSIHKLLANTALHVFATPVSSSSTERKLSTVSQIIIDMKTRSTADSTEYLVYAKFSLTS